MKNVRRSQIETSSQVTIMDCHPNCVAPPLVEMRDPKDLKPAQRNPRTRTKQDVRDLARVIRELGVIQPVIVDGKDQIVAGHSRWEAVKSLGIKLPTIRVTHLKEAQLKAFMLADNRLAEKSRWNRQLFAEVLQELQIALPEINLDLDAIGFEPGFVDSILTTVVDEPMIPDELPELISKTPVRTGDVFNLGQHRLVVGDARDETAYTRLLKGQTAAMAFLDPPYNAPTKGHIGGRGRIKHKNFQQAFGDQAPEEYIEWLKSTFVPCARHLPDGAIAYICNDWRHMHEMHVAGSAVFDELKNLCVWTKTTPGQGSFYRSQHELIFVYKKGAAAHLNTFELGQHGRSRSNVWTYAGVNTFRAGRLDELKMHPTVKPIALIADAMRDCSSRGSIVLDAFAGSGSTIMAAEQTGRRAFCIEIDPQYVSVAIRRWQKFSGRDAILESTGQTFDELEESRPDDVAAAS